MAGNESQLKKTLLGWVQGALSKVERQLDAPQAAPPEPAPAAERRAPKTGKLQPGSDTLVRSGSGPLPGGSGPLKRTPEEEAQESAKRLRFIMAYMKDPESDPAFKDKATVYSICSEERTHQQHRIVALQREIAQLPPPAEAMGLAEAEAAADPLYDGLEARRAELEERLATAQKRQTQIFLLMKKLTGVTGKTGGTGFLSAAAAPPAAPFDKDETGR